MRIREYSLFSRHNREPPKLSYPSIIIIATVESDKDALKCWNLEQIIGAEEKGTEKPQPITLNDLLGEEEEESDEGENNFTLI